MKSRVLELDEEGEGGMKLLLGDSLDILSKATENSVDAIVTDPPYELGFMGKKWDASGIAYSVDLWKQCLRVLKPGGHLLSFGGSRTYHRMACAIEDAGFEVRDQMMWLYGSGFPKSLDVSKAIDKANGNERNASPMSRKDTGFRFQAGGTESKPAVCEDAKQWQGWGTALKPAHEPIVVARKPLSEKTVAANVLKWGTGALNIDGCRIEGIPESPGSTPKSSVEGRRGSMAGPMDRVSYDASKGRFPANIILDEEAGEQLGEPSRFFYCAKASRKERGDANKHPTVKPIALMRYLVRLVTPPGGTVLDPFMGSGSTGVAAKEEGFVFIGIEIESEYVEIATGRIEPAPTDTEKRSEGEG